MIDVLVSDNPLVWNVRDGVKRLEVDPARFDSLASIVGYALFKAGKRWGDDVAVVVDGTVYSAEALAMSKGVGVRQVRVCACPGDPGSILISLAISAALSLASAALAPSVRAPRASGSNERPVGFGRYASEAVAGDVVPVVLGSVQGYGGKIVSMAPGEGEGGEDRLRLLICYGHGPIKGIGSFEAAVDGAAVTGVTGIKLQDRDLSQFPTAKVSVRLGAAGQAPIPGFDDTVTLRDVGVGGVELLNTDGADRTGGSASAEAVTYIGLDPIDAATLRVRFPTGLYRVSGSAAPVARTVKWRWRVRLSDVSGSPGSWSGWTVVTVSRGVTSEFFSSPLIDLTGSSGDPPARRDFQVERVTAASTEPLRDIDQMFFDSVVERRNADNDYPGMALLALDLVAGENLTGVPKVSSDIKGFAACSRWDTVSPLDTPVFVSGYSENPAALAHTVLTNAMWGLGLAYTDASIFLDSVARLESICDEAVAITGGGTRPRYAAGMVLDSAKQDVEWVSTLLAVARAELVSTGSRWRFVPDLPQDVPVEVYGEDDIVAGEDGLPTLSIGYDAVTGGLSKPNQLTAQIASTDLGGRTDTVVWPQVGELWLGGGSPEPLRAQSQRLDGVTSAEQAMAMIVYQLKRIRGAVRTVVFTTARDVPAVQTGDRFDLSVPDLGLGLATGLLAAGSAVDGVVLDQDLTLDSGETYTLTLTGADGTIESRTLAVKDGFYPAGSVLTPVEAFSVDVTVAPVRYALGRIGRVGLAFICTRVAPVEGPEGKIHWQIEGVEYVPGSHDAEEVDVPRRSVADYLDHSTPPGPMRALTASELVRPGDGAAVVQLAWVQAPRDRSITAAVRVYRRPLGTEAWVLLPTLTVGLYSVQIPVAELDLAYEFVAVAVTATGVGLSPGDPRHPVALVAVGAAAPPPEPPASLAIAAVTGNVYRLSWDAADGAVEYQVLACAQSSGAPNGGAADAAVVGRTTDTFMDLVLPTGVDRRFWVRSVGATGRLSFTASTVEQVSPAAPVGQSIKSGGASSWDLSTDGTLTNASWSTDRLRLTDGDADGVWESPELDTTTATDCQVVAWFDALNDAEDPDIEDVAFGVPSIEADQWGVVSGSGSSSVVGMLMPPAPDARQSYTVEVRVHDGSSWGPYLPLAYFARRSAMVRKVQARVTFARGVDGTAYRPALAAAGVVVTT